MLRHSAILLSLLAAAVSPVLALAAAQSLRIGPSGAIIYAAPKSNAKMTGSLRAGQVVVVTEPPRGGYYHVAMNRKYVGWVQESALNLPRPPEEAARPYSTPSAPAVPERHEPPTSYVGAFVGAGFAGGGYSLGFGADGGYKLSKFWGLGLYFEYLGLSSAAASASSATTGSTSLASTTTSSGGASLLIGAVELNYYVPQVPGLYVGIKGGMAVATANATATPTSTTTSASSSTGTSNSTGNTSSFAAGGAVAVGYDYPVMPTLSFGAEANYFFITGDLATKITNIMGSVKFVF